ncbi:MAG: terpene cyclase/mutase family protein [Bryobacterales bacterium]|nr:terpene cyclase/mutase family protein [Bryobacterales bacterium]
MERRLESLLAMRREDGSFSYRPGGVGLAECTCYALLALKASSYPQATEISRSLDWIETLSRDDGGFAPQPSVATSNWVTALVSIVMATYDRIEAQKRSLVWLLRATGAESARWRRTIQKFLGIELDYPQDYDGWPWAVGATAWTEPTVLGTLAMQKARVPGRFPALEAHINERYDDARKMLVDRRCASGGWNYGAPTALKIGADSYPETTGMALLGLQGMTDAVPGALAVARRMLDSKPHANGVSWLQLGLAASDQAAEAGEEEAIECRNCLDYALRVIALAAVGGNHVFRA